MQRKTILHFFCTARNNWKRARLLCYPKLSWLTLEDVKERKEYCSQRFQLGVLDIVVDQSAGYLDSLAGLLSQRDHGIEILLNQDPYYQYYRHSISIVKFHCKIFQNVQTTNFSMTPVEQQHTDWTG